MLSDTDCTEAWRDPQRFPSGPRFIVKKSYDGTPVSAEVKILRRIRDEDCVHFPELVWAPRGDDQLGIVPLGECIRNISLSAEESALVVDGLIDGLQHLHTIGIVHRDIRPSNLVLHDLGKSPNLLIVDYETAVNISEDDSERTYVGGFICWPPRLLENNIVHYVPDPADDLHASILVVLQLLFRLHLKTSGHAMSPLTLLNAGLGIRKRQTNSFSWGGL